MSITRIALTLSLLAGLTEPVTAQDTSPNTVGGLAQALLLQLVRERPAEVRDRVICVQAVLFTATSVDTLDTGAAVDTLRKLYGRVVPGPECDMRRQRISGVDSATAALLPKVPVVGSPIYHSPSGSLAVKIEVRLSTVSAPMSVGGAVHWAQLAGFMCAYEAKYENGHWRFTREQCAVS